jgi:DNA polymerase III sliding clamp (beta) subunit (PCNA family)
LDGFPKNDSITIGVKPAYILDILRCFTTKEVTLELNDPSSPILVQQEGITALTLPIRIA